MTYTTEQIERHLAIRAANVGEDGADVQIVRQLLAERDRQYDQNAAFIVRMAKLEAALTEAVHWNWMDHEDGADDPDSTSRIPESIVGPITALIGGDTND